MVEKAKLENDGFDAIYDKNSQVLILGTFPSPTSRKAGFYYSDKGNQFNKILSELFKSEIPHSKDEKIDYLKAHKVALYDVIESCEIIGSLDHTIKNPKPTDLTPIFNTANIKRVFINGKKAYELCKKFELDKLIVKETGHKPVLLLSSSGVNARYSLEEKLKNWSQILAV